MSRAEPTMENLARVGVGKCFAPQEVGKLLLLCKKCDRLWSPYSKSGGRKKAGLSLVSGWWICPNKCNAAGGNKP